VIKHFANRQFVIFLVTGGTAAAVNFCSRIVFNLWVSFSTAVVLAYLMGMLTAFVLARLFVFKESTQSVHRSVMFFTLVNLIAVVQTFIISLGLALYLFPMMGMEFFPREIAHAIGVVVPVFTSYIGHKHWSFK
jgi:putative flippase GtrA